MKIAILGAGVTGLSLARFLVEGGIPKESLHLFEADRVVGGLCQSKVIDGFTYDVAGGHILYSKDVAAMDWMKACAGGEEAFVRRDRNTRIRWEDRWVHYPFENGLGDLSKQANFECISGYVNAWHERRMNGSAAPADFKNWVRWRFGDGIAQHFMDPYNEKIWKRDLSEITSDWVAGRVPDAPVEDVLRSSVGIRTDGYTHQAVFFYPKSGGFQAITDGIGSVLTDQVRLSTPVQEIARAGETWSVNDEEFDVVINTLPLNELPPLFKEIPDEIARAMRELSYNSLASILIALDRTEHPELSWIYLPHEEQGPANRVTYMSNYSPGNAPPGKTSYMAEITWPRDQAFPGAELERDVIDGLVKAGILDRGEVLFTDRSQVKYAYIVYDREFEPRRTAALDWLAGQGMSTVGRFGHYDYDNSDQCVIKARGLASELLPQLARG